MEVSGQLQAPDALSQERQLSDLMETRLGWFQSQFEHVIIRDQNLVIKSIASQFTE
jgi:hypothetical protein